MKATKRVLGACLLGAILSVAGCSHSKPTDDDGEAVAKRLLVKNCKGDCIEITDFKKLDGTPGKMNGVKVYILEYEAVGKAKVPCWSDLPKLPQMSPVAFQQFHATTDKDAMQTPLPAGQEVKFRGEFKFHQSENGWRSDDIEDLDKDGKVVYY